MEKKKTSSKEKANTSRFNDFSGFVDPNLFNLENPAFFLPPLPQQSLDSSQMFNPLLAGASSGYPAMNMMNPAVLQMLSQGIDPQLDWQKVLMEQSASIPPMGYIPPELLFQNNGQPQLDPEKYGESSSKPQNNSSVGDKHIPSSSSPRHPKRSTPPSNTHRGRSTPPAHKSDKSFYNNATSSPSSQRKDENIKGKFQPNDLNEYLLQAEMLRQFEQQFILQQMQMQQQRSSPHSSKSSHNNMNPNSVNKLQEQLSHAIFQQLLLNGQPNPFPGSEMFHPAMLANDPAYFFTAKAPNKIKTPDFSRSKEKDFKKSTPSLLKQETDESFFANLYHKMQDPSTFHKPSSSSKQKIKSEYAHKSSDASRSSPFYERQSPSLSNIGMSPTNRHLELFSQLPKTEKNKTNSEPQQRKHSSEINNNSVKNKQDMLPGVSNTTFNDKNLPNMFNPSTMLPNNTIPGFDKALKEMYEATIIGKNFISPLELTKVNEALVSSIATEMQRLEKQKVALEEKLKKANNCDSGQSSTSKNYSDAVSMNDVEHDNINKDSAKQSSTADLSSLKSNELELNLPLKRGWEREVQFKEDSLEVFYIAPCGSKVTSYHDLIKYLTDNKVESLKPKNFSFCSKLRIGKFFEWNKEAEKWKELDENDLNKKMNDMDLVLKEAVLKFVSDNSRKNKIEHKERKSVENGYDFKSEDSFDKKDKQRIKQHGKDSQEQQRYKKIAQQQIEKEIQQQAFQEHQRMELIKQIKLEETLRKSQEKEQRRQQLLLLREVENRKRIEEREKKREELRVEKLMQRQKKNEQRQLAMEVARELKMPVEDMNVLNAPKLPKLTPLQGTYEINDENKQLSGMATADLLMAMEFVNTFNNVIQLKKSDIPSIVVMHQALLNDPDHIDSLVNIVIALLHQCLCDPGVPAPGPWLNCATGLKVTEVDVSKTNFSEVLRLVIWGRTGYKTDIAVRLETVSFLSLTPDEKTQCLAFLVNELVSSQPVCNEIDKNIDIMAVTRKDKWIVEGQMRQLRGAQDRNESVDITSYSAAASQPDKMFNKDDPNFNEEIQKQLEKLSQTHQNYTEKMLNGSKYLRGVNLGQDRFARRYWILPCIGGVYVESLESGLSYEDNIDVPYESDSSDSEEQKDDNDETQSNVQNNDESMDTNDEKNLDDSNVSIEMKTTSMEAADLSTEDNEETDLKMDDGNSSVHSHISESQSVETQDMPMDLSKPSKKISEEKTSNKIIRDTEMKDVETMSNSSQNSNNFSKMLIKQEFSTEFFAKYLREYPPPLSVIDIGQKEWLSDKNITLQKFDPSVSSQLIANALIAAENSCLGSLEQIKFPIKAPDVSESPAKIPKCMQFGWWKIDSEKQLREIQHHLTMRGIRERNLHRMIGKHIEHCKYSISTSKFPGFSEIADEENDNETNKTNVQQFQPSTVFEINVKVEREILHQVEQLWDKCVDLGIVTHKWSEQTKPSATKPNLTHVDVDVDMNSDTAKYDYINPITHHENSILGAAVTLTSQLESLLNRSYLKPPLVRKGGASEFSNLPSLSEAGATDIAAGLKTWRNAVSSAATPAQLAVCIDMLNSSIAWEKFTSSNISKIESGSLKTRRKKPEKRQASLPKQIEVMPSPKKKRRMRTKRKSKDEEASVNGTSPHIACDIITPQVAELCADNVTKVSENLENENMESATVEEAVVSSEPVVNSFKEKEQESEIPTKGKKKKKKSKKSKEEKKEKKLKKKKRKEMEANKREIELCRNVLHELQSHSEATWFLFPVDCKVVPGYRKVIKKPIDFHTIERRINKNKYKSRDEFVSDVNLVFTNCEIFNEDNSPIGRAGHQLKSFFKNRWDELTQVKTSSAPSVNGDNDNDQTTHSTNDNCCEG